ncbi:Formyl-CoA:oxalate CoA-transferase [Vanrija pseudolonga]|uniref:Formyl-CoA:oxalate CoA-transferase n=1 Tax=Vanrija pseudolonga TaxID=143232 RepID=A0AAF0YHJ3_9TREE|nr:Formyl-CoA:oxalate CoA-transferase [Vanrija pseudolonga]
MLAARRALQLRSVHTMATSRDSIAHAWLAAGLPESTLAAFTSPPGPQPTLPSSYKLGHLAQASIALAALGASQVQADRLGTPPAPVSVDTSAAAIAFKSDHFTRLDGERLPNPWGPIGGLHTVADGHVRIHDNFPHHCEGILQLLLCERRPADRAEVAEKIKSWGKVAFEDAAHDAGLCAYALRSEAEWAAEVQAEATLPLPEITRTGDGHHACPSFVAAPREVVARRPLAGLRVLELTRIIAGPVAGRTLAAYGADMLWITSLNLPDLPAVDRDVGRGKRTAQLDLDTEDGRAKLRELVAGADVFLQSYRPGSLAARGFGYDDVRAINPGIIYASLSAWGPHGPWANRRGFDSLVQTATGMNVSEAVAAGDANVVARPLPTQALDHGAGYFLAFGILAALHRRETEGGSYNVDVSLGGVQRWLAALGRLEDGFAVRDSAFEDADVQALLETRESGFGALNSTKHVGLIDGADVGPISTTSPARAPDRPKLEAKTLLIVYHSYTDGTRQMAQAAWEAATGVANEADVRFSVDPNDFGDAAQLPIQVQLVHAAEAEPEDLLNASSYIFATPENLASMSGVMKDFFDRCYYPCLDKLNGRAYAVLICAGSDGANALRQLDRIATGWRLRKAMDGTIVCTHAQAPERILATKTIPEADLKRCREVGEGMAEGLAMGVF